MSLNFSNISIKILKILAWLIACLAMLFILLVLVIRSPSGQQFIVNQATGYVATKTNTVVGIDKLFLTFDGNLLVEGVYLEDSKGDTLLYSESLEISVALLPLIKGDVINVDYINWIGLTANIIRKAHQADFNFSFIINAFASADTSTVTPSQSPPTQESVLPEIRVGEINLANINLTYDDEVLGMKSVLKMTELRLEMDAFDLEKMAFGIDEFELNGTTANYLQYAAMPQSEEPAEDTTSSPLPSIYISNLQINDLMAIYESKPDSLVINANIGQFNLTVQQADLQRQLIKLGEIDLSNSEVVFSDLSNASVDTTQTPSLENTAFIWPDWRVSLESITLENNAFELKTNTLPSQYNVFDPNHISLTDLNLEVEDLNYNPGSAALLLRKFSVREKSGVQLKQLAGAFALDNEQVKIKNLTLATNSNSLAGNVAMTYPNIDVFMSGDVEQFDLNIALSRFSLNARDGFYFAPELRNNPSVQATTASNLSGSLSMKGTLDQVNTSEFDLSWGDTKLKLMGSASHLLDSTQRLIDLPEIEISSTASSIKRLVPSMDSVTFIPEWLALTGSFSGDPKNVNSELSLKSALGDIQLGLAYSDQDSVTFSTELKTTDLQLGKALENPDLGNLSVSLKASGSGTTLSTLKGNIESDFQEIGYGNTDLRNLQLSGDIDNGLATVLMSYEDSTLNATLRSVVTLDTLSPKVELTLNVIGAALADLGITQRDIRTAFLLKGDFEGDAEQFDASLQISDGLVVYEQNAYPIGAFKAQTRVRPDSSNVTLTNEMINMDLASNTSPEGLISALDRQFQKYLGESQATDTVSKPAKMQMNLTVKEDPLLNKILLEDLEQFRDISLNVFFEEATDSLSAHFLAPFIQYGSSTLDSLKFDMVANSKQVDFNLNWLNIQSGSVSIGETSFLGEVRKDTLFVDFLSLDKREKLFHIQSEISLNADTMRYHINPSELIFNKAAWEIPEGNRLSMATDFICFENFVFANSQQELRLESTFEEGAAQTIDFFFSDFKLGTFSSLLNSESMLLSGKVSGNMSIIDPYGKTGLEADMKLENLGVMGNQIGTLALEGLSKDGRAYDFNLEVSGEPLQMALAGTYNALESGPEFDLDFDLERLQMKLIEGFSEGTIADASGFLKGKMKFSGSIDNPNYAGKFDFWEVRFNITALNSDFTLKDEMLKVDNEGLHLDNFTIADASANTFRLDGNIFTSSFTNPDLDLKLDAENFQVVNAKKGDNELFFGKVFLNAGLEITGSADIPKIRGDLKVNKGSDLTVLVPESQLDLVEREGVVVFVNKENPDRIITRFDDNETAADLTGIDLFAKLAVDESAVFRVLIDERSGDNFEVSGRGDFVIGLEPTGRTTLSGRYEVSSGHYKASLYGLVKRQFSISSESVITWSGDPLDANMDVTAIYNIETSPAPLMATSTSGADASTTNRFNAKLPFLVYLYVDGALLEPVISFGLGMPDQVRGAMGGEVTGRLDQLNQNESELNKQVFSLLVLNRFFPASGSDGSAGGAEAVARSNVSKVLSSQLNTFSERLLGETGFELDFGVNSYAADQTATGTSRTAVDVSASKKLFDERLVVQVGSEVGVEGSGQTTQEGTPLIGNVSLEYLLTENGRYRLRGYRKNEFTSIIDGQLIVTGIALIFNREFNKFKELFDETAERSPASNSINTDQR